MLSNESKQLMKKQAYWLKHLRGCEASGQPLATYAASHDLKPQQLYDWKSRVWAVGAWEPSETVRSKRPTMKPVQGVATAGLRIPSRSASTTAITCAGAGASTRRAMPAASPSPTPVYAWRTDTAACKSLAASAEICP
jgi:hypothetical protein